MREVLEISVLLLDINAPSKLQHSRGATEEGAMTFDTMLDHRGILRSECQRSSSRYQGACEPLRGHWPWPYDYRGCQVVCQVITPCWCLERI